MRRELIASEDTSDSNKLGLTPSTTIESLIVIDREVDYATPLLTQLTYEGLIDEAVGIKHNYADIDTSIVGAAPQPQTASKTVGAAPAQPKKRKILLEFNRQVVRPTQGYQFCYRGKLAKQSCSTAPN